MWIYDIEISYAHTHIDLNYKMTRYIVSSIVSLEMSRGLHFRPRLIFNSIGSITLLFELEITDILPPLLLKFIQTDHQMYSTVKDMQLFLCRKKESWVLIVE